MNRIKRVNIAKDTLQILKRGRYLLANEAAVSIQPAQSKAEAGTLIYSPEGLDDLVQSLPRGNRQTRYEVTGETTFDATRRLIEEGIDNPFALNFASAKNPGGGFLGGSQAQEECLARASGLYPCLLKAKESYYDFHRKNRTCFYSDTMIYSPLVPIFKEESGALMPQMILASILTSPAVNAGVVANREPHRIREINPVMRERIAKVLAVAAHHQHTTLVLGAWGCGVFRNDPQDIARLFQEELEGRFAGQFERIVFAVYAKDQRFIRPFQERFL